MRIVLSDFMSLDGVVQSPGGRGEDIDGGFAHGGWSMPYFEPETMGPAVDEAMAGTEALLFGRRTWQTMAAAWPSRAGDPFADRMNEIPKYVASRTLTQADLTWPGSTLLPADDAIGAIRALRTQDGQAIQVTGSASLAAQLIEHDLDDGNRDRRPDLHLPASRPFIRLARNDLVAPATMVMLWCRSPAVRVPCGITAKGGT